MFEPLAMLRRSLLGLAAAVIIVMGGPAAAPAGTPALTWPEDAYNPAPLPDDLVLPMPCGGAMVFRPIDVPGSGPFSDQQLALGGADEQFGYLAGRRVEHIAAAFAVPAPSNRFRYYLAKYEATVQQVAALRGTCLGDSRDAFLPATNLSWFDVVALANTYSQWLISNFGDRLPRSDGFPAFVRLPTETEWEYAARGGIAVSSAEFAARLFPMDPQDSLADYIVHQGPRSSNNRIQPVGSLKPNPLGLHDMLGNASEMIWDAFRLNKHGRSHGLAGGLVLRGGDFTMNESAQRTSWRLELPYYRPESGEPWREDRIGFRLVLTGLSPAATLPVSAIDQLENEWQRLPDATGLPSDQRERQAQAQIASVAAKTESEQMLLQLRDALADIESSRADRNEAMGRLLRSMIHNGAISAERVMDEYRRYQVQVAALDAVSQRLGEARAMLQRVQALPDRIPEAQAVIRDLERMQEQRQQARNTARTKLDTALLRYGDLVVDLGAEHDLGVLRREGEMLKTQLEARERRELLPPISVFLNHVATMKESGPLDMKRALSDMIERLSSQP